MRALYLGLAAAFSVVALLLKLFNVSNLGAVIALLLAAAFLVMGMKITADNRVVEPIVLDDEKRDILREYTSRDDEGAAIRQVQMWFRDATPAQARRAVQELD